MGGNIRCHNILFELLFRFWLLMLAVLMLAEKDCPNITSVFKKEFQIARTPLPKSLSTLSLLKPGSMYSRQNALFSRIRIDFRPRFHILPTRLLQLNFRTYQFLSKTLSRKRDILLVKEILNVRGLTVF